MVPYSVHSAARRLTAGPPARYEWPASAPISMAVPPPLLRLLGLARL